MSEEKLKRAKQLLAMTAADNVDEARSFAYQACKLIRECGFELVLGGAAPAAKPASVPVPKPTPVTYPPPKPYPPRPQAPDPRPQAPRAQYSNAHGDTSAQDLLDAMAHELRRSRDRY